MRAALLCLVLAACGCSQATVQQSATALPFVVLRDDLPPDKGAVTLCSWNNQPFVVVDSATLGQDVDEALLVHEAQHVAQIRAYRGGCWPYIYRYQRDSAFKVRMEYAAYCAEGSWLVAHNRRPDAVWAQIANTMLFRYGATVQNCIYEERIGQ